MMFPAQRVVLAGILVLGFCSPGLRANNKLPVIDLSELGNISQQKSQPVRNAWIINVQSLLGERLSRDIGVDGLWGSKSQAALNELCGRKVEKLDGPVWSKLLGPSEIYVIEFEYDENSLSDVFESKVSVVAHGANSTRVINTNIRGSIRPQDSAMNKVKGRAKKTGEDFKGRIIDGDYVLQLGFHRRVGGEPTKTDLVFKLQAPNRNAAGKDEHVRRPCLVVQQDQSIPIVDEHGRPIPRNPDSNAIHIHDSKEDARTSLGCLTLPPSDFEPFIKHFLDRFKSLPDWNIRFGRGRVVGVLRVRTIE